MFALCFFHKTGLPILRREFLGAALMMILASLAGCGGGSASSSSGTATTPVIAWADPAAITYGTALSATQLNATANVDGTFSYSPAVGKVLTAGTQTLTVTFTPLDLSKYTTATASVSLTVNKATPVITWDTPMPVPYGSWLGSAPLSAIASVAGTFTNSPAAGSYIDTLGSITLSATFTPTDSANYASTTATMPLTVTKGTPSISWPMPSAVVAGATLSATQLNASAKYGVAGTFAYSPAAGTVMDTPGTTTLLTTFTPADATDFNTASYSTTLTVLPAAGTAMVDFGAAGQTIRGFGASDAWYGAMSSDRISTLYGTASGDLGLSIMRLRIAPATWNASAQTADTSSWTAELANGKAAQDLGATIFASPWTPPASMKINNASRASGTDSGSLAPASYADFANYLKAYVAYATAQGVNLYAISMQNEPDFDPQTYESCLWTADEMASWAANYGSVPTAGTSVKLMMPESFSFAPGMSDSALNNSTAASNISIVGGHLYGASPSYPALAKSAGKEVWMTEHYLDSTSASSSSSSWSTTIADALAAAKEIHDSMTLGQYNAYVWWWLVNSNDSQPTGLIDSSNKPTYFGYAIEHFARFVRPGYLRYNATSSPVSGVYLSAYAGSGHQVIVIINTNTSSVSLPVQIENQTVTALTPYQTTASASLSQLSDIAVTGNALTATLPAQSITTYVQ
jgi:glucuronoarabinoxylan endo-1,4-beta-xylanase